MVTSRLTLLPELWSVSLFMIFHYHLRIGEVRTIRNETTYPIHGKYPLSQKLLCVWVRMIAGDSMDSHHESQSGFV